MTLLNNRNEMVFCITMCNKNIGAANLKGNIDGEAMRIISQHNLLLTEDWLI